MKKNSVTKKFTALLVVALLVLSACGAASEPVSEDIEPAAPVAQEPAEPGEEPAETAEPEGDRQFRIGVSLPPILNDFHATMVTEIENAIANAPDNFTFDVVGGGTVADGAEQLGVLEMFYTQNYDGVIISPWDGNLIGPITEQILNSGTEVVVINRMIEPAAFTSFVSGDNPGLARAAAHYIGEFLGEEGGNVFVLRMVAGTPIDAERQLALEVFEEYYPNIVIIGDAEGSNNAETGYESAMNAMSAHPHIDAIYAHDEFAARGALQAFEDAGRTEIRLATGYAGTRQFLQEVEENPDTKLRVAAYLPIMGAIAVETMLDILNGIQVERYIFHDTIIFSPTNVDEWRDLAF